jgi:hypothetical protein
MDPRFRSLRRISDFFLLRSGDGLDSGRRGGLSDQSDTVAAIDRRQTERSARHRRWANEHLHSENCRLYGLR